MKTPKTSIILQMPKKSIEKLKRDWQTDPNGVMDYFKQMGFDIIDMKFPIVTEVIDK